MLDSRCSQIICRRDFRNDISQGQTENGKTATLTVLLHKIDQAEVESTVVNAARNNIETSGIAIYI